VENFFSYVGGLTDLEVIIGARTFFNLLGVAKITYSFLDEKNCCDFNFLYFFNTSLIKLSKLPTFCLLLGVNARFEAPLLNLRLARLVVDYNVPIYKIGVTSHYSTFKVKHISNTLNTFFEICEFKHLFCKNFYLSKFLLNPFILVGQSIINCCGGSLLVSALLGFTGRLITLRQYSIYNTLMLSEFLLFGFVSTYSGRLHALDAGFSKSILNFTSLTALNSLYFRNYFNGTSLFYSVGHDESVMSSPKLERLNNL